MSRNVYDDVEFTVGRAAEIRDREAPETRVFKLRPKAKVQQEQILYYLSDASKFIYMTHKGGWQCSDRGPKIPDAIFDKFLSRGYLLAFDTVFRLKPERYVRTGARKPKFKFKA